MAEKMVGNSFSGSSDCCCEDRGVLRRWWGRLVRGSFGAIAKLGPAADLRLPAGMVAVGFCVGDMAVARPLHSVL